MRTSPSIGARQQSGKRCPLSGKAHAEMRELGFLPLLFPQVDRATGRLTSDVELGGTLGAPEINGALVIDDGALDSYVTNMQLRDLKARVELKGNGLTLSASVRAGSGTATLDGQMAWRDRAPHGRFKFKGTDLELVNVPEAQVRVSPDLTLSHRRTRDWRRWRGTDPEGAAGAGGSEQGDPRVFG